MKSLKQKHVLILAVLCVFFYSAPVLATPYVEDFESGYTDGAAIRLHGDWFTESSRTNPTIEDNVGLNGTWGLSDGSPIFVWTAHPFNWNDPDLTGVVVQMDLQSNSAGTGNAFNDDRVGWMISDTDDSSDHIFGIQFDDSDNKIEGYWDGVTAKDKRPLITTWSPKRSTWYRLRATITKLTATSARIDVQVHELNNDGSIADANVATGSIADTSTLGSDAPNSKYFTPTEMWPGYKNFSSSSDGAADNTYFEALADTLVPTPVISGYILEPNDSPLTGVSVDSNNSGGSDTTDLNGLYEISVPDDWSGVVTATMPGYIFEPESKSYLNVTSDIINQNFVGTKQVAPANWTAYNDCVYDTTQHEVAINPNGQLVHYIAANVTTFGVGSGFSGSTSGELVDIATGIGTGVTATLTQSGGVVWQPDASSNWYGGYDTAVGTDARNTFGGIADMTGVTYYGSSAGWYVDLVFTGLNPDKKYTFATSAARCKPTYTTRYSVYSISGADSVANASTSGVNVTSDTEVWFNTGDNYNDGYVARWTNVEPGSDGSFSVRATHHSTADSGRKAYAFDVFMLQEMVDPTKASNPDPEHNEADVDLDKILSWYIGVDAAYHDVYFGTDFNDVNDANIVITYGVYQDTVAVDMNYFDPCGLEYAQDYYWRIDEVNDANVWRGDVWKFTAIAPECNSILSGDFDGDCVVDINDLKILSGEWLISGTAGESTPIEYIIAISVDGLHGGHLQSIIDDNNAPNFKRFQTEGAFTNNARTDYDYTVTLPTHACMITGRAVNGAEGHNVNFNSDNGGTFADAHGSYVASGFDVVHDNSLRTGFYASKSKFDFYDRSYNAINGAVDTTGADDGKDKIDVYLNNSDTGALTSSFISAMQSDPFNLSFVCFADPDVVGHSSGWGSANWNNSVIDVDGYIGSIFNLVENDANLVGKTAIILTADHGGNGTGHGTNSDPNNYTIPFYVWSPGVPAGTDIYDLVTSKLDPATSRPTYADPNQPIRNGNILNLALRLLGFDGIPGSTIDGMDLGVYALPVVVLEDFENATNFPADSNISDSPEWFSMDNTPGDQVKISDTNGVADSRGLTSGDQIFIWTAHPLKWTAVNLQAVVFELDLKTDGSGVLDDDRVGWMISDSNTSSDFIFGVQIDPEVSNTRLEGYWDHIIGVDKDKRPVIDEIAGNLSPDTWYRLSAKFTKLSGTSAKIDASLTEFDSLGEPVGFPVLSGTIANTSLIAGGEEPDTLYFTADTLWPAYKNFDNIAGEADNAYFEVIANEACEPPLDSDVTGDCEVDFEDFSQMALDWLKCNLLPYDACP